jgi:hypothetical protein
MIQLQGRYAWVRHEDCQRLLHAESDEPGDVRTMPIDGWIAFAQARKSEAQMAYDGIRCGPDGIVDELNSQGIPYRIDEKRALVLVSVSHFQRFMQKLVLDCESIAADVRAKLLLGRSNRHYPKATEPKIIKVNKHPDRIARPAVTLDDKPLPNPVFSVHPGASIDQWGPMMQTGMINEAFRELTFYSHDCDLDVGLRDDYRILSVVIQDKPFVVTNHSSWPLTSCRILVASKALPNSPGVLRDRWVILAPSRFLIVDNYEYRGVRQITLLVLTETQTPFFLSGMTPQVKKLAKNARGDLHQNGAKPESRGTNISQSTPTEFSTKPLILSPYGDYQQNPALVAWLTEQR